jgi:hypothetical protein
MAQAFSKEGVWFGAYSRVPLLDYGETPVSTVTRECLQPHTRTNGIAVHRLPTTMTLQPSLNTRH